MAAVRSTEELAIGKLCAKSCPCNCAVRTCARSSGAIILCNVMPCSAYGPVVWQTSRAPSTKGVTHNQAIDLVMQNCGACVLRDRNASVATVNRIIKASILFEIKNETVFFSYSPSAERMKEFDRKSKLIPKPFAGPMAALY